MYLTQPQSRNTASYDVLAAALRLHRVIVPVGGTHASASAAIARGVMGPRLGAVLHSQLELETLGFVYSKELLLTLSWLSENKLAHVHTNVVGMLKRELGAHQRFSPMYPNFPKQVLEASAEELLVNAAMHYLGDYLGVRILPRYTESHRITRLMEKQKPTVLALAPEDEIDQMLLRLMNGNAALSPANKQLLEQLLVCQPAGTLVSLLAQAELPQKETLAQVGGWLLREAPDTFAVANMARLFKTATDVLRLAAAVGCSGSLWKADLSLSAPPYFGRMSRGQRRQLLDLLNQVTGSALEEMFLRREEWLRLGEALHPREYARRFQNAADLFQALRDNKKPTNWLGQAEKHLKAKRTSALVEQLSGRPGVFARKLHEVLRKTPAPQQADVVATFEWVVDKVSTPVLLQVRHRFLADQTGMRQARAFPPKAGSGRLWVPGELAPQAPKAIAQDVVQLVSAELGRRFSKLPALGKVYVDPALEGYTVPFGQRTAQKALHTVGRGTRLDLGEDRILRAFLWWSETGTDKTGKAYSVGRTDLDLSCSVYDEHFNHLTHCSYTALRQDGLTHSGDITSAPKGACEFIDIDFDNLPTGAAYIGLVAYAYTSQNFGDLPEAYLGWMTRKDGQTDAIYKASTVRQKVDLTASGRRILVGYADVANRQFIWGDLVLPAKCDGWNAIETSTDMLGQLGRGLVQALRPTLGDLAALHAAARGTRVATPEEADYCFMARPTPGQLVKGLTSFEAERIAAELLV